MGFAVTNVNPAVGIGIDPVGSAHLAFERISISPVTFFPGPGDQFDPARPRIDHPDRVAFAIGEPHIAGRIDADAFGAAQSGFEGGPAMSGKASFAGSGDVVDLSCLELKLEDLIPLPRREPEIPFPVEIERAGSFQGRAGDRRAVRGVACLACSGKGRDRAGLHLDLPDDVVADVANV